MSLAVSIHIHGLLEAELALARLNPLDTSELLEGLARNLQMQTRSRIEDEKTSPDGVPWKPNLRGGSILYITGALSKSIQTVVSGMQVIVGSGGLAYSRIQQFGGTIVPKTAGALAFNIGNTPVVAQSVTLPARPYIGVSAENRVELIDTAVSVIRKRLGL